MSTAPRELWAQHLGYGTVDMAPWARRAQHLEHGTMARTPWAWNHGHYRHSTTGTAPYALWEQHRGHGTAEPVRSENTTKITHPNHQLVTTVRTNPHHSAPRAQHRRHSPMGTAPQAQHHGHGQNTAPSSQQGSIYVTEGEKPRGAGQPIFIRNVQRRYETRSLGSENKRQERAALLREHRARSAAPRTSNRRHARQPQCPRMLRAVANRRVPAHPLPAALCSCPKAPWLRHTWPRELPFACPIFREQGSVAPTTVRLQSL